jgi:hypothetical protein
VVKTVFATLGVLLTTAVFSAMPLRMVPADSANASTHRGSAVSPKEVNGDDCTPLTSKLATAAQVKTLVANSVKIKKLGSTVASELATATGDNASHKCSIPSVCSTAETCDYGDTTATTSIVLYGDSLARMWLPAVVTAANNAQVKVILIGQDFCPVVTIDLTPSSEFPNCNSVRTNDIAAIDSIRPVSIILADRTTYPQFTSTQWQAGMAATIDSLIPSGAKISVIGNTQVMSKSPVSCLATYASNVPQCYSKNPAKYPGKASAERNAVLAAKGLYINPTSWMCTSKICSPVIGKYIAYWDSYHISVSYAKYLSGVMGSSIKPLL